MDLNCDSNCNESYYFILKSEMLNQQLKYKCDLTFMLYFVSLSTGSQTVISHIFHTEMIIYLENRINKCSQKMIKFLANRA